MSLAIIDNATLTAVQRLLGEITIRNKHAIDGDILAFETLIQTILFFDEVAYIDDYKSEFRDSRKRYFSHLSTIEIDENSYNSLLAETNKVTSDIVPRIEGGEFTDPNFKPFFELLQMHNIFTWDMSSSVYYLTQKMLQGGRNTIDVDKYSKLNQMIFTEYQDSFERTAISQATPVILDSSGMPITSTHTIIDKDGRSQEAHLSKQTNLLFANLSWLAYRTIFYTLVAKDSESALVLHPIRDAFQINYLSKVFPSSQHIFRNLIATMNTSAEEAVASIFDATQPMVLKYRLPMFTIALISKVGDPGKIIDAAYHLKNENDFVKAREKINRLNDLFGTNNAKATRDANILIREIHATMNQICSKYGVNTPQGVSLSPLITAYNLASMTTGGVLPSIPNYSAKIKSLDFVKNLIPRNGFSAVYKSLVNDLAQIGRLGQYHELLTSNISLHRDASYYTAKEEDERFRRAKSYWKVPM